MPRLASELQQNWHSPACSAQQCMNMLINWKRHSAEGQHIIGGIDSLTCAVLLKSLLLDASLPWVEHHKLFVGYFRRYSYIKTISDRHSIHFYENGNH